MNDVALQKTELAREIEKELYTRATARRRELRGRDAGESAAQIAL